MGDVSDSLDEAYTVTSTMRDVLTDLGPFRVQAADRGGRSCLQGDS